MQQFSTSIDFLVELSDDIFAKKEAGPSFATFSHFILATLTNTLSSEREKELVGEIIDGLLTPFMKRMHTVPENSGISDSGVMEKLRRSLKEYGEKVGQLKQAQDITDYKIHLERSKANLNHAYRQHEDNENALEQCAKLEKAFEKKFSDFEKRIVKEQTAQLKQVLFDQRVVFTDMIRKERDIAYELLRKTRLDDNEEMSKEQEKIDGWNNQSRALVKELVHDCSRLMSLFEELIPLIEQQEVRANKNVEVEDQMTKMEASTPWESDEEADEMKANKRRKMEDESY